MKGDSIKALVLTGGTGTRLKPLTNTTTKRLLPVANRRTLSYMMDVVKEIGIESTGIITSPEWGKQLENLVHNMEQVEDIHLLLEHVITTCLREGHRKCLEIDNEAPKWLHVAKFIGQ